MSISIPIGLSHNSFRSIVLSFDKTNRKKYREIFKESKNFLSPIFKRRDSFLKSIWSFLLHVFDPCIKALGCISHGGCGIPCTQGFFQLPCFLKKRQSSPNPFPFLCFCFCQIFFCFQKQVLLPMEKHDSFLSVV